MAAESSGMVVAVHGKEVIVESTDRTRHRCIPRQHLTTLVCGDRVTWTTATTGHGSITQIMPRHGELRAIAKDGKPRLVAANVDHVAIVTAAQPPLQIPLLDRYLIACEIAAIQPLVVFNKIDLLNDADKNKIEQLLTTYQNLGYPLFLLSAQTGMGITLLQTALADKTVVLVGQSGVGKSSIIRALVPDAQARIGDLSTQQGRHTTTHSELYHLPQGGQLIDSPGVRSFNLLPTDTKILAHAFVEFRPYLGQCRFTDCSHTQEPGCAIRGAVQACAITDHRYNSYVSLLSKN